MPNLQLNIKKEPEEVLDDPQGFSYDGIPVWDFLATRLRLFIIENRDLVAVALVLTLGFGVIWTAWVSSEPTTVSSQAAGTDSALPTAAVTIIVATPTPTLASTEVLLTPTPLLSLIPTIPPALPTSPIPVLPTVTTVRTNPYWEYLPTPP